MPLERFVEPLAEKLDLSQNFVRALLEGLWVSRRIVRQMVEASGDNYCGCLSIPYFRNHPTHPVILTKKPPDGFPLTSSTERAINREG